VKGCQDALNGHPAQAVVHSLKPLDAIHMHAGKLSQFKLG
jgi:hypothetical protein